MVESQPSKLLVASSILVSRSRFHFRQIGCAEADGRLAAVEERLQLNGEMGMAHRSFQRFAS